MVVVVVAIELGRIEVVLVGVAGHVGVALVLVRFLVRDYISFSS